MLATLERKPLGQLLIGKGLIKAEQLDRALQSQRESGHQKLLGEILVELNDCTEEQVTEALAQASGLPFARITPRLADPGAVALLPKPFLERHQAIPLFNVDGKLTVALAETSNVFLVEEIKSITGCRVNVVAATARDILATLRCYDAERKRFASSPVVTDESPEPAAASHQIEAGEDDAAIKLIDHCLQDALKASATDVHIEPAGSSLRVRYRIDGRLTERLRPPIQLHAAVVARLKSMAALDPSERRRPQDGSVRVNLDGRSIELRVTTAPGTLGEKLVLRVIDGERAAVNLEKLGFSYESLKRWRKLIAQPQGIILIAGPVGCGKDTTLYSSIRERSSDDLNVCTIEDPVRYALPGVNQFQVDESTGFSFAAGIRSILRQCPDILMIGEIRDAEVAALAAQAALSGHLVFATLPTNDAPSTLTRLFNLAVEPYVLSATLCGVLAQRLVRRLCQHCKEAFEPTANERREIERYANTVATIYRARGCPQCHNTGYSGRLGIYELLVPDDIFRDRIAHGGSLPDLRELAKKSGIKTLRADGMDKVKAGITTVDEVYRVTS